MPSIKKLDPVAARNRAANRQKLLDLVYGILGGPCSARCMDDSDDVVATGLALTRAILTAFENGEIEIPPIDEDHTMYGEDVDMDKLSKVLDRL